MIGWSTKSLNSFLIWAVSSVLCQLIKDQGSVFLLQASTPTQQATQPNQANHRNNSAQRPQRNVRQAPSLSLPSHEELMKGFQCHLGVTWSDVYVGTAVEQAFVRLAGIGRDQEGAMYRRMRSGDTYFVLSLDAQDTRQLRQYYSRHFPNLNLRAASHTQAGWQRITVDTRVLYHQVAPACGQGHAPGQGHNAAPLANNQSGQVGSALGALGAAASGALHRK